MYNNSQYNDLQYNDILNFGTTASQDSIIFNNFSLDNPRGSCSGVYTSLVNDLNPPVRQLETSSYPMRDGRFTISDFTEEKIIPITGEIKETSVSDLFTAIDNFKKNIYNKLEGILDIKHPHGDINGTIRRYIATVQDERLFDAYRNYQTYYVPYSIRFYVADGFGRDVDYSSQSETLKSLLLFNANFINAGTTNAEPIYYFRFDAVNNVTAINIKNNENNNEIEVTTNISAGDILEINAETTDVTLNGTSISWDGILEDSLETGSNLHTITITGTSCTYDYTLKHKSTYI